MVSTVSAYRSPVRLVLHAGEEASGYSPQAISRARKKMMAEIALAGDEVVIDGVAYARNDAAVLLDGVTEAGWKMHQVIYTHKGLLDFLEKERFDEEALKKADAWLYKTAFVAAVSPYFAHAFNAVSGRLLRNNDFEALTTLLHYGGYMLPEHGHEGFQKLRTWFDELRYTLRNLSWEKFAADESVLHFVFSDEWRRFFNKLPAAFSTQRDEVVESLINRVLHFQNKATWHYLHQVLLQLKELEVSDFNRAELERIDAIIGQNSRIEAKREAGESASSPWRTGWWAVWALLLVVRALTCNTSDWKKGIDLTEKVQTLPTPKNARINETYNEERLLGLFDSLQTAARLQQNNRLPEPATGSQPFSAFANGFDDLQGHTVRVINNTPHHCVLLCSNGPSRRRSVYEGALPNLQAVFIRKGGTFSFAYTPRNNRFYFLFGNRWGPLQEAAELTVSSPGAVWSNGTRDQPVFVYEFFEADSAFRNNPYLQTAIFIEDSTTPQKPAAFRYLNRPRPLQDGVALDLLLTDSNRHITVAARGALQLKQEKAAEAARRKKEERSLQAMLNRR